MLFAIYYHLEKEIVVKIQFGEPEETWGKDFIPY